jgi:hypothetical protein
MRATGLPLLLSGIFPPARQARDLKDFRGRASVRNRNHESARYQAPTPEVASCSQTQEGICREAKQKGSIREKGARRASASDRRTSRRASASA